MHWDMGGVCMIWPCVSTFNEPKCMRPNLASLIELELYPLGFKLYKTFWLFLDILLLLCI
jgi:hypothetical protein